MMLRYLDENKTADRIVTALKDVLSEGFARMHNLGGTSTTVEFINAISKKMEAISPP